MASIQIDIPEELDIKIKVYQAKHKIPKKKEAIIEMLHKVKVDYKS